MVKNYKPCKKTAQKIKPDEIDGVELFMTRVKTLADTYDKIPIPEKCFVTSSTKLFEFAKEYLKDTGIKVLFNDSVPTYTSYLMSEKDYKKVGGKSE